VHYLAFDLFVGCWEVRNSQRFGVRHWFVVPCLILTFFVRTGRAAGILRSAVDFHASDLGGRRRDRGHSTFRIASLSSALGDRRAAEGCKPSAALSKG
jgi:hypothetical protein